MNTRLQVILLIFLMLAIIRIVRSVSKGRIDFKFGIGWISICCILLIMTMFPGILSWLSGLVGIEVPLNFLIILGILLIVWLVFKMTHTIAVLQDKVKRLSQEIAILRKDTSENWLEEPKKDHVQDV